ncbi:hypothetical protein PHYPSEUDO_005680 [Phytophthora pseudosyringae]|uniref:Uncharacterized protein n=1 Tax=Phytophthora pseudosyringae TaxID=221518 RepID=A0A8T1VNG0_9STRA|nr:hypothetical protein PHYPSEUDO_005680 [Phytophthora pseudosyringae]
MIAAPATCSYRLEEDINLSLVGENGNALTSAASVSLDIEDVVAFRKAVKKEYADSDLAGVAASNLTVFANRAAYNTKQALEEDSPIGSFGGVKKDALIVQVPQRAGLALKTQASYPPFLKKAIETANVMLTHNGYFRLELGTNRTTKANLRDVKVDFRRPEKGSIYGWTD